MRKKLTSIFLSILFLLQIVLMPATVFAITDDDDNEYVDPNAAQPEIILINGPVYEVTAGKTNTVKIKLRNGSAYGAKAIVIQPTFTDIDNTPFTVGFEGNENRLSALAPRSETEIELTVDVERTATTKNYPVTLNYSYFNAYNVKFTGTNTIYLKVNNLSGEPDFKFENVTITPSNIEAGDTTTITGQITNNNFITMHEVNLTLEGLSSDGISVNNSLDSKHFSRIPSGSTQSFSFPLIAGSEIAGGTYPITLKITYKDEAGRSYDKSQNYYINVGGSSTEKPSIEIRNMTEPSGTYEVNQNFEISFDLINTGEGEAKNIKVTASGMGESGAVVPKSTSVKNIKTLAPNETIHFSFTFAGTSSASTQNYPVEFTIEYESSSGKATTLKQYAGVNVSNAKKDKEEEEDEQKSKPKIIVSDYVCDPLIVMAGNEFDLTMTLMNSHKQKSVHNIKMFLTMTEETSSDTEKTGNIFTPVNSSNTFYFDDIVPKGKVDKALRLYVVPDAQPKTYTLTVNFEYEDQDGNEYTSQELLGINVKQVTQLDIDEYTLPEQIEMGMPVTINFSYYNTGKVTLNNLMIRIEGDVQTDNRNTYIGNLESGSSDYYEATFTATATGELPVSVIVSYDDASGETIEEKRDFILNVTEPMPIEDMTDMDNMGSGNGISKPIIIAIVIGVIVIIAIIVAVMIVKHKKKKAEEAFLAEDDEYEFAPEDVDYYEQMPNTQQSSSNQQGRDNNEHF